MNSYAYVNSSRIKEAGLIMMTIFCYLLIALIFGALVFGFLFYGFGAIFLDNVSQKTIYSNGVSFVIPVHNPPDSGTVFLLCLFAGFFALRVVLFILAFGWEEARLNFRISYLFHG